MTDDRQSITFDAQIMDTGGGSLGVRVTKQAKLIGLSKGDLVTVTISVKGGSN